MRDQERAVPVRGSSGNWHEPTAGFLAYAFDARDFMLPAPAMPSLDGRWSIVAG